MDTPIKTAKKVIGKIELNRIKIRAYHGVFAQERIRGNDFEVTVHLSYDMTDAAQSDELSQSVDYSRVLEIIRTTMSRPSRLLENVASRLKENILADFPQVTGGFVKVTKLNPPVSLPMRAFAVKMEW